MEQELSLNNLPDESLVTTFSYSRLHTTNDGIGRAGPVVCDNKLTFVVYNSAVAFWYDQTFSA